MMRELEKKGRVAHIIHLLKTWSVAFFPVLVLPLTEISLTEMRMDVIELMRRAATEISSEYGDDLFETTEAQ